MKLIPLSRGLFALVDDEDFDAINSMKWWALERRKELGFYACRDVRVGAKRVCVYMHRLLLGAASYQQVDHVNGNGLDNQRINLRICDQSENNANQRFSGRNTSGYRGVCYDSNRDKWMAQIGREVGKKHLGRYDNAVDAALAYDRAAKETWGIFAKLNFLDKDIH